MPNLSFDVPGGMEFTADPANPAEPRDAATVILLRDGARGLEVFLLRRVATMAFAAGMTVFPGGGVDKRDVDASVAWAGPPVNDWARWFGGAEPVARALVCAAVRETFEESGVLLAGTAEAVVENASRYADARQALVSREMSLAEFLTGNDLTLRADLLRPWAHWVTPVEERKRYDTRFFAAALPAGQHADGATTEAESSAWRRPQDALADADAGHSMLLPPTRHTLTELAEFGSAAEALDSHREIETIIPTLIREGNRVRVVVGEEK